MKNWKYINGAEIGNSTVGNANILVYQKDYGNGRKVTITKNQEMDNYYFWSLFDGTARVAFGSADSLSQAQSQSHAVAERREKWLKKINGNSIPDSQINGPSGAEIREIAGRVYKTDMRKDDLARAVSFELAKKYKSFQTNSHIMDMVSEVLSKFKTGNETMHEWATSKPKNVGNGRIFQREYVEPFSKNKIKEVVKIEGDRIPSWIQKAGDKDENVFRTALQGGIPGAKYELYVNGQLKQKVGNALKYTSLEEAKKMCQLMNDTLAPDAALRHYRHVYEKDGLYYVMETGEAVAKGMKRAKTGNAKVINSDREFFKELADDVKEREEKYDDDIEKVGNKTYKVKKSSGHDGGYDYGYIVVDENDRSVGRTFSTRSEAEEYMEGLYKKERVGNSAYDDGAKKGKEDKRKGKLITAAGFEYHAPGYSSLSFKEKEEYRKGYYSTNDLKKEDIYKWGNSASDDKFSYVMREFDEGKLKTPDGKVVTDPAQAKAIAYSESKKTENGLTRARNAIKK